MADSDPIGYLATGDGAAMVYAHDVRGAGLRDHVQIGDTIATVGEWADALDLPRARVSSRLRDGDTVLHALREHGRGSDDLEWEDDHAAQAFVEEHPHGASLAEIGDFFGLSRERIRQIEAASLARARAACIVVGIDEQTLLYSLQQRTDRWQGMCLANHDMSGSSTSSFRRSPRAGDGEQRCLRALAGGQALTRKDLVAATGLSSACVYESMVRLERAGRAESWRDGRSLRYQRAGAAATRRAS